MTNLVSISKGHALASLAAASWKRMVRDGMPTSGLTSSYRTEARQWELYRNRGKKGWPKYAAHPAESKHVWRPNDPKDKGARAVDVSGATREWMIRNAAKYGWFRPWPTVEPWHFEYDQKRDKSMASPEEIAKAVVKELLGTTLTTSAGQRKAVSRTSMPLHKALTDAGTGGLITWKQFAELKTEVTALRQAVATLTRSQGLDPRTVERILGESVDKALAGIRVTLSVDDES